MQRRANRVTIWLEVRKKLLLLLVLCYLKGLRTGRGAEMVAERSVGVKGKISCRFLLDIELLIFCCVFWILWQKNKNNPDRQNWGGEEEQCGLDLTGNWETTCENDPLENILLSVGWKLESLELTNAEYCRTPSKWRHLEANCPTSAQENPKRSSLDYNERQPKNVSIRF